MGCPSSLRVGEQVMVDGRGRDIILSGVVTGKASMLLGTDCQPHL